MNLGRTCITEKKDSDFHKRNASKDGLAARCKACQLDYHHARLKDPKRMEMRRNYQKTAKDKLAHSRACKHWAEKNQVKQSCSYPCWQQH